MAAGFRRVGVLSSGYDVEEVDEFFDHARGVYEGTVEGELTGSDLRSASFEMVRHGYVPAQVDAALDRLEMAFTQKRRAKVVSQLGQEAWLSEASSLAKTLYGRLVRPEGEKFAPGYSGEPSYDREEVDALCDDLVGYFDRGEKLSAKEIRATRFARRRGSRGYDEGSVDAFLDRAVEVMLLVE